MSLNSPATMEETQLLARIAALHGWVGFPSAIENDVIVAIRQHVQRHVVAQSVTERTIKIEPAPTPFRHMLSPGLMTAIWRELHQAEREYAKSPGNNPPLTSKQSGLYEALTALFTYDANLVAYTVKETGE